MSIVNRISRLGMLSSAAVLLLFLVAFQSMGQSNLQDEDQNTYKHEVRDQIITFEAVNPKTENPGVVTVTITAAYRGRRLLDGEFAGGAHIRGDQAATFTFVPYDSFQPSYSGKINTLALSGDTKEDSIFFDYVFKARGTDGSSQLFKFRELVKLNESGGEISFAQLKLPDNLDPDAFACDSPQ